VSEYENQHQNQGQRKKPGLASVQRQRRLLPRSQWGGWRIEAQYVQERTYAPREFELLSRRGVVSYHAAQGMTGGCGGHGI